MSQNLEQRNENNEVDQELIELMKQSQTQWLMDECAVIERISGVGVSEKNTTKNHH